MALHPVARTLADISILEVGGADETMPADLRLTGEMMEHQHALAQAIRANLESGAVHGEGVVTAEPLAGIARRGIFRVVLAVVENHLEHPHDVLKCRLG